MTDATNTIQRTNENHQFRIVLVITNLTREIQIIQNGVQKPFFQNLYQIQQDVDANKDFEDYQEDLTDDEIIQNQTNFRNPTPASLEDNPIVFEVRPAFSFCCACTSISALS